MLLSSAKRILLKISGNILQGQKASGICWETLYTICNHIAELAKYYEFALVIGGGNFFRGRDGKGYCPQGTADNMGMLSTIMNGLAFTAAFKKTGIHSRLFCAQQISGIGEIYSVDAAQDALNNKEIIICAGGLGHGAMTTDTAAVVRACELECDLILKGTTLQGIYSDDPMINSEAIFLPKLTYQYMIQQQLRMLDLTSITLALENNKPLIVFSLTTSEGLLGLFQGSSLCSVVTKN